mmetsp:Transcript_11398/g.12420  ORF Transcript_11398/g.12420 Transcript_11398/m.12420 type:complete len:120 (-) Transcript_11398:5-364(-)
MKCITTLLQANIITAIQEKVSVDGYTPVNFQCTEQYCNTELIGCLNDHEGPEADGPEGGKGNQCSEVIRCVYGKQSQDLAEAQKVDYHQCFAGQQLHGKTSQYDLLEQCIISKACADKR